MSIDVSLNDYILRMLRFNFRKANNEQNSCRINTDTQRNFAFNIFPTVEYILQAKNLYLYKIYIYVCIYIYIYIYIIFVLYICTRFFILKMIEDDKR